jgi:AhpD family alkylhydroperoxidase
MTQARIQNPALTVPGALDAFQQLGASPKHAEIPEATLAMVTLRASQINGCSVCVDIHTRELEHIGESSERIHLVAAWREAPYFSDAERAALALSEAAKRLADRPDPGARRGLGPSRPPLHRAPARGPGGRDRDDQRVQPHQRHHPADHRRLRSPHRRNGRRSPRLSTDPRRDERAAVRSSRRVQAAPALRTPRRTAPALRSARRRSLPPEPGDRNVANATARRGPAGGEKRSCGPRQRYARN